MRSILFGLFFAASTLCAGDFHLYENGKPSAVIIVPGPSAYKGMTTPGFSRKINADIREFSARTGSCCKTALPVVRKKDPSKNTIIICPVERPFAEYDHFRIDFPDKRTMRITGTWHSVKFAFDHLLETAFGVRYLWQYPSWMKRPAGYDQAFDTSYPYSQNVSVPVKNISQKPSFNFGRTYHATFARDWKMRHTFPYSHAMAVYPYPVEKYAPDNSWPQEILPVKNGKRFVMPKYDPGKKRPFDAYHLFWQPCWSNPLSVKIAVKNIMERFAKGPVDPVFGAKYYHVALGVNDNGGCCECGPCKKAVGGKVVDGYLNYSELYWKWVDSIAREITGKYPHIYVHALAYREVFSPPSFKLHPNVIVQICREIFTGILSPEEKHKIIKVLSSWKQKASTLLLFDYMDNYDYPRGNLYVIPRYYVKPYAEMLRLAYAHGVRGITLESNNNIPVGGPNLYLVSKLLWDIRTDVDKALKDWCVHAVGKKAAPYLERYYLFWQDYWLHPDLRKTAWFDSVSNIYMALNEGGSYTYALKKGQMASLRRLLQKTIDLAETPLQKRRAEFIMRVFAITENAVRCLYSELIRPEGKVASAEDAVLLLRSLPEARKAMQYLEKEPLVSGRMKRLLSLSIANLEPVREYVSHPAVRKEMAKLLLDKNISALMKSQIRLLRGDPFRNLLEDGSFEKKSIPEGKYIFRDKKHVSHGNFSLKTFSRTVSMQTNRIKPGYSYLVMADLYMDKPSAEGYLNWLTNPRRGKRNAAWYARKITLRSGFQTISRIVSVPPSQAGRKGCDNLSVIFWFIKYERNEAIWIDNVRVYELGKTEAVNQ